MRKSHQAQLGEPKLHCNIRSQLQEKKSLCETKTTTRKKSLCETKTQLQVKKSPCETVTLWDKDTKTRNKVPLLDKVTLWNKYKKQSHLFRQICNLFLEYKGATKIKLPYEIKSGNYKIKNK